MTLRSHQLTARMPLARTALELLAEHEELNLIVDGEHTRASNAAQNVGTRALEQRLDAFLGDDLSSCIKRGLVFDGLG